MTSTRRGRLAPVALLAALLGACATQPRDPAAAQLRALNDLLAEHWEWHLQRSPELATIIGDYRFNDRWSDPSLAHVKRQRDDQAAFLASFEAIDPAGFAEQDRLNRELIIRQLREAIRAIDLKLHEMPIEQIGGWHLLIAQFVALVPLENTRHYEDYLARLNRMPQLFDDLIAVMEQGRRDGLMPPRFLLEKTARQCHDIAGPAGVDSPFSHALKNFPEAMPEGERQRLRTAILEAIDTKVRPAYRKLGTYIAREYAPHGRSDPGVWALPDGETIYEFLIELRTTLRRSPEEVHQLGLAEVARIETEQLKIARQLGFKTLRAMRAALAKDPKAHPTSRQQMLDLYAHYNSRMDKKLPELFGLLPKTGVEVVAVEEFREKEDAAASYWSGTPDGKRKGRIYVNTGDFAQRSLSDIETTAYHEGVPGHHMQASITQVLPGLPPFRQHGGYTAHAEGWALYAERLGREVGFYEDPLSYFGHLDAELLRATRLVLDTGVHHKRWTRKQMVAYFRAHSGESETGIQAETDRYIVWPGQALAYKSGQLKILELRQRARNTLGARFDIRAFHDHMLDGGALPLDVLESRFDRWLAAQAAER